MASVSGAQFHFASSENVSGSGSDATAGHLSLTSIAAYDATIGGGGSTGFDSVNSPSAGGLAGQPAGASDNLVTTQASGGNTIVHLPDGSSLTVIGTTHLDGGFFH